MGEVVYLDGAATEVGHAAPSMRQPVIREPASQPERLGEVTARVLEGLTVSGDDHRNVTALWISCGENV